MKRHAATFLVAIAGLLLGCAQAQSDPSPSPVALTGRVELADEGVALDLPDGWYAEPVSIAHDDPGPVARREVLHARHDYGPGGCTLWIETTQDESLATLAAYTERLISDYERDPEMTGSYLELSLPAGPATRATFEYDYEDPPSHAEYLLERDGIVYRLACVGHDPYADDWLSMAEAVEFMR